MTSTTNEVIATKTVGVGTLDPIAEDEVLERIRGIRNELGRSIAVLCHHYQRDEVFRFADFTGDSYRLSADAAALRDCWALVFLGVHFMAESAAILGPEERPVILPNLDAGCPMADMAPLGSVERAWDEIVEVVPDPASVMPVTYMNSTAELKAFVGRKGGTVCTSSNARAAFEWAWKQRVRIFFFPDQHLGRNTAKGMGIPLDAMVVWDPEEPFGGNDPEAIRRARLLLWKGHCSVHQQFVPGHVTLRRKEMPDVKILVHPECSMEVVDEADLVGSTGFIIRSVSNAAPGSTFAIGTEIHLVHRLKQRFPDKIIESLSPFMCLCSTMYRNSPRDLLRVLENLREGKIVHRISVEHDVRLWARVALDRMLEIH